MQNIEKIWKKPFMIFSKTGTGLIRRQKFRVILSFQLCWFLFIFCAKLFFLTLPAPFPWYSTSFET